MKHTLLAVLALLAWTPVSAQEWQVARERYAFGGTRLTIQVDAETAGSLQVIRGSAGSVAIASRTEHGFTAAGLAESDLLTLTAVGDGEVNFLVSVPENVRVQVRLPGSSYGNSVGGGRRSRTFHWGESRRPEALRTHVESVPEWLPPLDADSAILFTTFVRDQAPAEVILPDLANVRSLSIHIEEGRFQASTSRPLSVHEGSDARVEIRPAGPPMDIVLTVPLGTPSFRIVANGHTALIVEGGSITALCSPVTQQWLSNGRRWVTFNPVDGTLRCSATPGPRRQGTAG